MTPWLQDVDVTLYHGDALSVLRELPAESVDCCVTSPPYWGLRDYGTAGWNGGAPDCDHHPTSQAVLEMNLRLSEVACSRCGATRIDQQLGLEPTPEEYVHRMVEVFREVRRVLAAHGTVWLNLGDSYAAGNSVPPGVTSTLGLGRGKGTMASVRARQEAKHAVATQRVPPAGLKPKDLVGIPWRVAFALQADGWYLRSDIIWAKPNPMPESVTDRPTKAHEYVFLLSKQPRYFFDQEAVREAAIYPGKQLGVVRGTKRRATANGRGSEATGNESLSRSYAVDAVTPTAGRNIRSVWEIATQPYAEAHFATFPEELARRCIAAGCPESVCRVCEKARERITDRGELIGRDRGGNYKGREEEVIAAKPAGARIAMNPGTPGLAYENNTVGWTACKCSAPVVASDSDMSGASGKPGAGADKYRSGVMLDPFIGSGTVAHVARKLGRHAVGIDLSEEYLKLAARRLQQQSLFAEPTA